MDDANMNTPPDNSAEHSIPAMGHSPHAIAPSRVKKLILTAAITLCLAAGIAGALLFCKPVTPSEPATLPDHPDEIAPLQNAAPKDLRDLSHFSRLKGDELFTLLGAPDSIWSGYCDGELPDIPCT